MTKLSETTIGPWLSFEISRSAGPGGQNVNKLNTRVTAVFNVAECGLLRSDQKQRIRARLATRCDKTGQLRVSAQRFRTQLANRRAAVSTLVNLLEQALAVPKHRKPTQPTRASRERRLVSKRQRAQIKQQRMQRRRGQGDD